MAPNRDRTPSGYPGVGETKDQAAAKSLRMLWDQIRNMGRNINTQQNLLNAQAAALAAVKATADRANTLALTNFAVGTGPIPGGGGGTPTSGGGDGPIIDGPCKNDAVGQPSVTGGISITDEISLASVTILNSPSDIATWTQSATITAFDWQIDGAFVDFTKRDGADRWPDFVPPGFTGPIEYTLWGFFNIDGTWYGSGGIEYWQGLPRNGGPPHCMARNWFGDAGRWAPMTTHQPEIGENVGFMVSAGDARNNRGQAIKERSQVFLVPFFTNDGGTFTAA